MWIIIRALAGIPVLMLAERRRKKKQDRDCDLDFSDCGDAFSGDGGHDSGHSGD